MNSVRVCIGTDPSSQVPAQVLRFSINKNRKTGLNTHFFEIQPQSPKLEKLGMTGFSFQRFSIPEYFNFEGKAIYLDSDQLVLCDIIHLWNKNITNPHPDTAAWCVYRGRIPATSVMLLDCERAKTQAPRLSEIQTYLTESGDDGFRTRYRRVMRGRLLKTPPQRIEPVWNHLDRYEPGETKLIHFTDRKRQPWRQPGHPQEDLWLSYLKEAMAAGYVSEDELRNESARFRPGEIGQNARGIHPYILERLGLTDRVQTQLQSEKAVECSP